MHQDHAISRRGFIVAGIGTLMALTGCQEREPKAEPKKSKTDSTQTATKAKKDNNPKDVFTIVGVERGEDDEYGYWEMNVTVKNNSNEAQNFLGFQVDELDADGNIINSYMSYNKNASYTVVEPGQSYTIDLTEAVKDNIAGMQSRYCEYGEEDDPIRSDYSTPYKQMF